MKTSRYKALDITSTKKPQNTHLWWETVAGGLYLVDSTDNTKIYYSSDKGENWVQIDVDPSNSSGDNKSRDHKIQSAWHDWDNKIIWFVDGDNPGDDFDVWKLDYSGSESSPSVTEVGTSSGATENTVFVFDIFIFGANILAISKEFQGSHKIILWDVAAGAPSILDTNPTNATFGGMTYGLEASSSFIFYHQEVDAADTMWQFQVIGTSLSSHVGVFGGLYKLPSSRTLQGVAFDGTKLFFILEKISDGLNYLVTTIENGSEDIVRGRYDVALMLDRNIVSGGFEKAYHLTESKIYQLNTK